MIVLKQIFDFISEKTLKSFNKFMIQFLQTAKRAPVQFPPR